MDEFAKQRAHMIESMGRDQTLQQQGRDLLMASGAYNYSYNFDWMGVPIIQFPQDIMAVQEIIWKVQPGAIIETGVARGGSLIFSASMLQLIGGDGLVVGIDIDIREPNREAIESHPMAPRIQLIEGSATDPEIAAQARDAIGDRGPVLVMLDSNHTHDHVLRELELYAPFVSVGSYIVVFDTAIEDAPADYFPDRPWGKGNSPKSAVWEFLKNNHRFEIDREVENKLLLSTAPDGYLRCIKD